MELADVIERWGRAHRTKLDESEVMVLRRAWAGIRVVPEGRRLVDDLDAEDSRAIMEMFDKPERPEVADILNRVLSWARSERRAATGETDGGSDGRSPSGDCKQEPEAETDEASADASAGADGSASAPDAESLDPQPAQSGVGSTGGVSFERGGEGAADVGGRLEAGFTIGFDGGSARAALSPPSAGLADHTSTEGASRTDSDDHEGAPDAGNDFHDYQNGGQDDDGQNDAGDLGGHDGDGDGDGDGQIEPAPESGAALPRVMFDDVQNGGSMPLVDEADHSTTDNLHFGGVAAHGVDAHGVDAHGVGAAGVDAHGVDAHGVDADGVGAAGLDADGVDAGGLDAGGAASSEAGRSVAFENDVVELATREAAALRKLLRTRKKPS